MTGPHVLIAGGGIGGLTVALTLHQLGVSFTVLEGAPELAPLGVGINLQPNAVRELGDLGIGPDVLDRIGIPAREWALVGRNGNEIYSEPRGIEAPAMMMRLSRSFTRFLGRSWRGRFQAIVSRSSCSSPRVAFSASPRSISAPAEPAAPKAMRAYCRRADAWFALFFTRSSALFFIASSFSSSKISRPLTMAPSLWRYQGVDPMRASLNRLLVQNCVTGCTVMINRALRARAARDSGVAGGA